MDKRERSGQQTPETNEPRCLEDHSEALTDDPMEKITEMGVRLLEIWMVRGRRATQKHRGL